MVDQNSIFGGMLTTLGAAKKTNCDALGIPWEPRYMLIGDANGTDPVPSPTQTKLINQRYRAQLNQLRVSPTDDNVLIAELVLPPDVGGWWIRELALEDKDGVFSAVANVAPSYKPLLAQGSGRNQVVRMHIITSGTSNIQLKIDPSVVLATRKYVDDSIKTLYSKAEIEAMIAEASALPVGTMAAFPVNKIPPGFLEVDGSIKSIAAYPDLAAYLGAAFNRGDEGAENFRLPESRAEFLRGWDHGRGIDAGRAVGSLQAQQTEDHTHATGVNDTGTAAVSIQNARGVGTGSGQWPYGATAIGVPGTNTVSANTSYTATGEDSWLKTGPNIPLGTGETRPRNLAVIWCIKAWNAPINQGNIDIAALEALATQATEIKLGTAKIATQALTDAGADDTTIVTPKKLRWGFSAQISGNGSSSYVVFPSWLGGVILQWGTTTVINSGANLTVPFPVAFNVTPVVLLTYANAANDATNGQAFVAQSRLFQTAQMIVRNLGPAVAQYFYLAIGR